MRSDVAKLTIRHRRSWPRPPHNEPLRITARIGVPAGQPHPHASWWHDHRRNAIITRRGVASRISAPARIRVQSDKVISTCRLERRRCLIRCWHGGQRIRRNLHRQKCWHQSRRRSQDAPTRRACASRSLRAASRAALWSALRCRHWSGAAQTAPWVIPAAWRGGIGPGHLNAAL
jgi:hypothetical protein